MIVHGLRLVTPAIDFVSTGRPPRFPLLEQAYPGVATCITAALPPIQAAGYYYVHL